MDHTQKDGGDQVPFRDQRASSAFIMLCHLNPTWQVWEDSQSNNSTTQNGQF